MSSICGYAVEQPYTLRHDRRTRCSVIPTETSSSFTAGTHSRACWNSTYPIAGQISSTPSSYMKIDLPRRVYRGCTSKGVNATVSVIATGHRIATNAKNIGEINLANSVLGTRCSKYSPGSVRGNAVDGSSPGGPRTRRLTFCTLESIEIISRDRTAVNHYGLILVYLAALATSF